MSVKYIGSKRTLVDDIVRQSSYLPEVKSVLDLFSGTSRVGQAFKKDNFQVFSNDHNAYAYTLATCYVQSDKERWQKQAWQLIQELNKMKGVPGYFTDTFCVKSRYFQPKNGERIDVIREEIEKKSLGPELKSIVLTSLMEAADRVDSTAGVQMAYLKNWSARASNDLELRLPRLIPRAVNGKSRAYKMDAQAAAKKIDADLVYLDPPYNQHSYLGNYHIWESLVLWDKPEVYGVACKRVDCKERKSDFNSKLSYRDALLQVIDTVKAPYLLISFNNEGYWSREDLEFELEQRGKLSVCETDYKRYVGAQIGIYNLKGEKVGKVSHLKNKEYLYILSR